MLRRSMYLLLTGLSCSPAQTPPAPAREPPPARADTEPSRPVATASSEVPSEVPAVEPVPAGGRTSASFAESPITPLALQLVALTDAAIRGQPLPATDFPIERYDADDPLVRGDRVEAGKLDVLAFAIEVDVAIERLQFPPGPDQPTALEIMLILTEHGLKVLEIDDSHASRLPAPPKWFPIATVTNELVADLRRKRVDRWLIGEQELALLGPEIRDEVEKDRMTAEQAAKLQPVVARAGKLTGARPDDVAILARDERGTYWGLELGFESGSESELDSHPLVRVKRNPK